MGGPATAREPASPPRPLIILVHGRGQLGLDSAALRREWKRDLDASLQAVGMPALQETDVRLAWYADVLDPGGVPECRPVADTSSEAGLGMFARGFLATLSAVVGESAQEDVREARGVIGDLLYLIDGSTRCAAKHRVGQVIQSAAKDGRPIVIVAYSLGSVVAYEYLSRITAGTSALPELRLITLGSPLGVPEIREILLGDGVPALTMPNGVVTWVNIYDPNDAFAAPLGVSGVGSLQDRVTERAASGDPHHISGYLRDRETGLAVARALCATTKRLFGEGCNRL